MAKGNGTTRAGVSSSPNGLSNNSLTSIRGRIENIVAGGGNLWRNKELVDLRTQELQVMRTALWQEAGKNGWYLGYNNIEKAYGADNVINSEEPIRGISISVATGDIKDGSHYEVRIVGSQISSNANFVQDKNAFENSAPKFYDVKKAIRWGDSQVKRINNKYRGKI